MSDFCEKCESNVGVLLMMLWGGNVGLAEASLLPLPLPSYSLGNGEGGECGARIGREGSGVDLPVGPNHHRP